jgi:hypothetical protein
VPLWDKNLSNAGSHLYHTIYKISFEAAQSFDSDLNKGEQKEFTTKARSAQRRLLLFIFSQKKTFVFPVSRQAGLCLCGIKI